MSAPVAILHPSPVRRAFALGALLMLGALMAWVALSQPPGALGARIALLLVAAGAVWMALRGWAGTRQPLLLDRAGLRQADGRVIAPLAAIRAVDRGVFAFKPSSGFVLRLHDAPGAAWVPGLWWRVGRRVGVGGVTGGAEGRMMADTLTAMLAERDAR